MKKKNKRNNIKISVIAPNIEMENKKDVILIKNNVDKLSEDDIKKLIEIIEKENQHMKDMYFAFNTPVVSTRQRTFRDLVKKFFARAREKFDLRTEDIILKNRI